MSKVIRLPKKRRLWPELIIILVAVYLLYSFAHLGLALYQTNLQIQAYENQKAALLQENTRLRQEIQELNSDSYIEKVAREELGLVKPGERVIMSAQPGQVRPYKPPEPGHQFRD
ncbi:Cell division protein FtsL [Moorella thermoacetica]|uniref:Cell division protein FtsB n=1 Tax=Neomoorella thermoacetica TaxID=1525 RepID=A0A1D7X6P8_NEOTH|nr:septum formation initiator family protein [Moorella thermoacetica]AOQ22590.1 cell division protein FtsB [Moorella thermoacetica]OIQ10276.1 cell division protein FtsL [Moorella thermoacetica]OIQ11957.1 cell division protein FtsL [Moorella thermoacetica]TYL13165.1 Cell division protein FtsL [Moorella thermoacetica]